MAEILAQWLNEEVGLSRRVTNFEEDFSSGYLFGELLWKFNQQADFEEFSKKDAISHRLQNFEKLEPSLRNLNIKFDSKMVDKIMKRERGLALRLLYQLKMCLEKVYPTTDIAVLTKTGQFGDNQPAQKIANSKEKYDRIQHKFFKERINALNKPQKQLNMEAHLKKFDEEAKIQANFAARCDNEDKQVAAMRKQEMRRIQINKLQRNAGFMEEWHQKGVEDWKKNQKRQRDRESKQLEFDLKQAQKFNSIAEKKLQDAKDEVSDGIDAFENTLKSNGINPRVQKGDADKAISDSFNAKSGMPGITKGATSRALSQSLGGKGGSATMGMSVTTKGGAYTLESTGLKQRTKKTLTEAARKQREKRRRRLIGQQEESMKELELKQREEMVTELIKHQSNQEKELDYEVWRTNQCKEVISKNRQLRESQYEERRELDKKTAQGKEQEMLKTMQEATQRIVQERIERSAEMSAYQASQKTRNHSQLCAGLLDQIIDIADEAYNHQQRNDSKEIDNRNWHEWVQLFLHDMPITGTLDSLANLIPQEDSGENIAEKEAQIDASNLKLDELELVDYLKNLGQWTTDIVTKNKPKLDEILNPPAEVDAKGKAKAPAKGAPAEVTFDEAELEVSDAPENNFLLGDAIEQIIKINFAERARLKHPQNPNWLSVKICLAGYPFAGKKEQAERLSKKFNLDIFVMEALVQEAIDFAVAHPEPIEAPAKPEAANENKDDGSKAEASAAEDAAQNEDAQADPAGSEKEEKKEEGEQQKADDGSAKSQAAASNKSQKDGEAASEKAKEDAGEEKKGDESMSDICMSEDEEDDDCNLEEQFRQIGLKMQELLLDGEEISDDLYVKAFVTKLRMQYPYKDPKTKQQELKQQAKRTVEINERLRNIQDELNQEDIKRKQIKALEAEKATLNDELEVLKSTEAMGWVLVDFPCNYAQAKLLEEAMSGFKPSAELDPISRYQEMEEAFQIVQPTAKEAPPKLLIKSGLDAVVWFKCPLRECQRRADGRRIDVEEFDKPHQTFYHVNDQVPPMDCAPLCERLEPIDEDRNHTSALVDRVVSFDQQETSMRKWLTAFGVEERQYNLLQEIDANCSKDDVTDQISKIIDNILDNKQTEKESMRELFIMKIRQMIDSKQKQAIADAQNATSDQHDKSIEDLDLNKTGEMSKLSNRGDTKEETKRSRQDKSAADLEVNASAEIGKSALSSALSGNAVIPQLPERDNIDNDFKPVIIELWRELARNYKSQMKRVFRNIRLQREQASIRNSNLKMQFLEFLHTSDGKQDILDEFVKNFNEFSDEYPDLREDDQTKEELHQRTDALSDELWEIVEERKEQAVEFRKKIMESGFVEFNLDFLTQIAQQLMQAEVDKFKTQIQIIHDYYHAIEEKLIPEAPPASIVEIGFNEGEEPPAVENLPEGADATKIESYAYPRLDRLLAMAIKQQVVVDVTQVQATADPKKGGKKDAKKGAPAAEEEKAIEESIYVKEMREAIKISKSNFRYRLCQVRNWALNQLKDMRQNSLDLYKMLEDWIFVAQKTEMDAIEEMCIVIKDSIEEETKIQSELRIKFMDFTVDQGVLNYITPPPPKHAALEEDSSVRFSIVQIQNTVNEFQIFQRMAGGKHRNLRVQFLYQYFKSRVNNSESYQSFTSTLPEVWNTMGMDNFMAMIRNLDPESTGWIDTRQLLTYFILLQSPVLDLQEAAKLQLLADSEGCIGKETFTNTTFWFEETEGSKDRHYHLPFERKRFIKEELFRVNSDCNEEGQEPQVNIGALVKILTAPLSAKGVKTYNDFLFAPTICAQK